MTELTGEKLYAAYRERVLAYLTGRAESREDAEDLCQKVFAEVLRCLPRYDPEKASLSTWIYQITRFTLIDYLRTRHPSAPLTPELSAAGGPEEDFLRRETLERLASALTALEQEERDIIVLRYYRDQTQMEISRLTGISYGMVKVKHKRALNTLRALLEREGR